MQPFYVVPERGIKDFAQLYAIDESSTEVLVRNAAAIVAGQSLHEIKDGKVHARHDTVGEFVKLMDPQLVPTREQLQSAVKTQFRLAIGRMPNEAEIARFIALCEKCAAACDRPAAVKVMLQPVLLKAEAMYRSEMGVDEGGVGPRCSHRPSSCALSLSLGNRRDGELIKAAEKGELGTKEQIATHVRSMLDDPKGERNARVLKFFREYFEYNKAVDVFKDKPSDLMHEPRQLVADTDRLVQYIVEQDRDVLRELLTTPKSFVNLVMKENKQSRKHDVPTRAVVPNPHNNKGQAVIETLYDLAEWTEHQPVTLPENTRLGILMQPSWLSNARGRSRTPDAVAGLLNVANCNIQFDLPLCSVNAVSHNRTMAAPLATTRLPANDSSAWVRLVQLDGPLARLLVSASGTAARCRCGCLPRSFQCTCRKCSQLRKARRQQVF